jgi:hypothetical protein
MSQFAPLKNYVRAVRAVLLMAIAPSMVLLPFGAHAEASRLNVQDSVAGALIYLDDMQIRQRPGKGDCNHDASVGDSCGFPAPVRNLEGEWASRIFLLPTLAGELSEYDRYPIQDSNMFTTAGVAFPLAFIKDRSPTQAIQGMKNLALKDIQRFRHGDAYDFWITIPGRTSPQPVVGPMNLSPVTLNKLFSFFSNPIFMALLEMILGKHSNGNTWEKQMGDPTINPYGMDSAFNIPNDADDTSVAVVIDKLYSSNTDLKAMQAIFQHRDTDRPKRDKRNEWIAKDSGLFLTWLKDDTLPPFADPTTGVIPIGVNNVDCVVNENVLLAMGLTSTGDAETIRTIANFTHDVIKQNKWPKCGLYYPQQMMFPYAASRAFRDGSIRTPEMQAAMDDLLKVLLTQQQRDGSFSGGTDGTKDLSTALGAVTLINIGRSTAIRLSLADRYDQALRKAVRYLKYSQIEHATRGSYGGYGYKWQPGVFFSASGWSVANWKSEAYTVAITLEALTKYMLGYDLTDESIENGRKLVIREWHNTPGALKSQFVVE